MTDFICIALAAAGFALLAASMDRHQRDVIGRKLTPVASQRLRAAGMAMQALSLLVGMLDAGADVGVIAWFGHITVGAGLVLTWLCSSAARKKSSNKAGVKK